MRGAGPKPCTALLAHKSKITKGEDQVVKSQQDEVYDAEQDVPSGRTFRNVQVAQEWVDGLRDTWWWQRWYWRIPRVEVEMYDPRQDMLLNHAAMGIWDEDANGGLIITKRSGLCERIFTHELAHVVARALHNSKAHDPVWARDYANLTYLIMGGPAWLALQAAFDKYKIEY